MVPRLNHSSSLVAESDQVPKESVTVQQVPVTILEASIAEHSVVEGVADVSGPLDSACMAGVAVGPKQQQPYADSAVSTEAPVATSVNSSPSVGGQTQVHVEDPILGSGGQQTHEEIESEAFTTASSDVIKADGARLARYVSRSDI